MRIAHISDFHVFSLAPETPLVRADAETAARKVVADIVAFRPKIDAVMFTGDLTDGGSPADYALLTDILSPLQIPVFVVPGNHDRRSNLIAAFNHLPFSNHGFAQYQAFLEDVRILALDTVEEGKSEGYLCDKRLRWIEDRLAEPHDGLTLVLMHHPPFPSGMKPLDRMSLVGGKNRLSALIANYSGKLRILSGHIHRPYHAYWNNAFCAVAGSPAFQVDLAFTDPDEPPVAAQPFAWYLHVLEHERLSVHARFVEV